MGHAPPVVPVQQVVTVQGPKGRGCIGTVFAGIGGFVVLIFVLLLLILIF